MTQQFCRRTKREGRGPHVLEAWRSGISGQLLPTTFFAILLYYGSTLLRTNIAGGGSCTSSKLLPTTDLLHCSITNVRCSATNAAHGVKFLLGLGAGGWWPVGTVAGRLWLVTPCSVRSHFDSRSSQLLASPNRRSTFLENHERHGG